MNQRLAGGPEEEGSYNVGVGDIRKLLVVLGEALDVPMEGFTGLLLAVLEVPWVPRVLVCALEVPHERSPLDPANSGLCWTAGVPTTPVPNRLRIVEGCG